MKSNTSGLPGISFRLRPGEGAAKRPNVYVTAAWTDKDKAKRHTDYSIRQNGGPVAAMMRALVARNEAGLPPIGIVTALRALRQYLERIDYPVPDDLREGPWARDA